jgi:hypothetical protein
MTRRGQTRPIVATTDSVPVENAPPSASEKPEKKGFLSRLFTKKDSNKKQQTAATTTRKRRRSRLADDELCDQETVLVTEINETETKIKELESQESIAPPPPLPPPPPPPPPPGPMKRYIDQKLERIVKHPMGAAPVAAMFHLDMISQLKGMNRGKLRPTGIRRSIGGTPIKETKEVALSGEAELLSAVKIRPESSSDDESSENDAEVVDAPEDKDEATGEAPVKGDE